MEKVIAVFDIGKTNKKIILFNSKLQVVFQHEEKFPVKIDEDGVECDDIALIRNWIVSALEDIVTKKKFDLCAVNFSTYGATLAWVNEAGTLLTPIYNYLKPIDEKYQNHLFDNYGGQAEFCRKTASPALGVMLNSAVQIKWMKAERSFLYSQSKYILHFPQYLSSVLTNKYVSEYTSIGCHTFMWDFDKMEYHQWLKDENVKLPQPISNSTTFSVDVNSKKVMCGVGIHDSSASLVPYFKGNDAKFLLISTGTWCINMNPFNHTPLTAHELNNDCLCYMSINQKPVKSSRLFMGHIHDVNVQRLAAFFNVEANAYKKVEANYDLLSAMLDEGETSKMFFLNGIPENFIDESVNLELLQDFSTAYHRLMFDLTLQTVKSINLVSSQNDDVKNVFVSGGFARNEIFVLLLAAFFPSKEVFTTQIDNASALGAALVVFNDAFPSDKPNVDLGLKLWTNPQVSHA